MLGHEKPKLFALRIAFNAGDDPAQHEIASIKCGSNVKHTCIRCMYKSREGGQYDSNTDTLRDMTIKNNIKAGVVIYEKYLTNVKITQAERKILNELTDNGYHSINNSFFEATFGLNNHIYKSSTDVMNCFHVD